MCIRSGGFNNAFTYVINERIFVAHFYTLRPCISCKTLSKSIVCFSWFRSVVSHFAKSSSSHILVTQSRTKQNYRCSTLNTHSLLIEIFLASLQAWQWVVSEVKRTRAQHSSTDLITQMQHQSMPTWAITGLIPPWWGIHQPWRHTTTATIVTQPPSLHLVGHLRSWHHLAGPPLLLHLWLWAALSPVLSQVSACG